MNPSNYRTNNITIKSCALFFCLFSIILLALIVRFSIAHAQDRKPGEYQVKAAFLYNLLKFVDWPDDKNTRSGVINICVLGEDPFSDAFDFAKNKTIENRRLVIKHFKTLQHIENCHALFISRSEQEYLEQILKAIKGLNILTFGDTEGFAQRGVIINFYIEENKVRFEININSLRRSGWRISSKVMRLARIIQE